MTEQSRFNVKDTPQDTHHLQPGRAGSSGSIDTECHFRHTFETCDSACDLKRPQFTPRKSTTSTRVITVALHTTYRQILSKCSRDRHWILSPYIARDPWSRPGYTAISFVALFRTLQYCLVDSNHRSDVAAGPLCLTMARMRTTLHSEGRGGEGMGRHTDLDVKRSIVTRSRGTHIVTH